MNEHAPIVRNPDAQIRTRIVDCDIHPAASSETIKRYLAPEWHEYHDRFRGFSRSPFAAMDPYSGIEPNAARRDTYPTDGGLPGSSLELMRTQYLDIFDIECGVLQPLAPTGNTQRNVEYGAALSRAINLWQLDRWTQDEKRLKASITVQQDYAEHAVEEIHRHAGNADFVQVMLHQRCSEPLGRKRYWPIYEAAQAHDLPISIHVGGNGGHPSAGGAGFASYHIQQHQLVHQGFTAFSLSLIMEGVFEAFPRLKVILVEGGFTWIPSFLWRMDSIWRRMRSELPYLKRPPSEYFRTNVWVSSQPMDVYKNNDDLRQIIDWIGWDRLCFASDYPHWDFDDPRYVFAFELTAEQKAAVFSNNAKAALRT